MKDTKRFQVVESKFNLSQAKVTSAKAVRKGLSRVAAQAVADKLNDRQSLAEDAEVLLSYLVHPENKQVRV